MRFENQTLVLAVPGSDKTSGSSLVHCQVVLEVGSGSVPRLTWTGQVPEDMEAVDLQGDQEAGWDQFWAAVG